MPPEHPIYPPDPPPPGPAPRLALCCCLLAGLGVGAFSPPAAPAQGPPLRLDSLALGGVRTSATESWGTFDFTVINPGDADRSARVLLSYEGQPDVQYGRDVWVPARSALSSWLLAGPAPPQRSDRARELRFLLYDRTGGADQLVLPPGEERVRARAVFYRKREPYTVILLDEEPRPEPSFGQLPRHPSAAEEAVLFARTFRQARQLSALVQPANPGELPPSAEAFDGIDQFIIASGRIADDPAGMLALRRWLEGGGTVWVMLDLVDPEAVAPLLGDALDFHLVDRVGLTSFRVEARRRGGRAMPEPVQAHERPVVLARVLLPGHERAPHTVNGWPAWFSRDVGRGRVVFTTLGPRGWSRPRKPTDRPSPYPEYPTLPVQTEALDVLADQVYPAPEADPFSPEVFRRPLAEEIGYSVVGRRTAGLVFGGFLLGALALGAALRRARRPELLGWLGPAAAVAAAALFLALGESSRRAAAPTVAVAQVVDPASGTEEAAVHGLLAVYRPDAGPAEAGASPGGRFDLDMAGLEGHTALRVQTDMSAWHWEGLELPAGLRLAPFRFTAPTGEPVRAVASFGPGGLEGRLAAGPFRGLADAVLCPPGGRNLAVRLGPDHTFRAGGQDALPAGEFLAGAVLSDAQQRRQDLFRAFFRRPEAARLVRRPLLLAWAGPVETPFTLAPGARVVGDALLVLPLEVERPAPGVKFTIPGSLLPYRRILRGGAVRAPLESPGAIDMHLRFQLPPEVLPLEVERARVIAKVSAPSRRVTVSGLAGDRLVELRRVESPLDPFAVDITDARLLRPDEEGGLHVNLSVSEPVPGGPAGGDEKWAIRYLELEVTGRAPAGQ